MSTALARTVPERGAPRVEARGLALQLGTGTAAAHSRGDDDLSPGSRRLAGTSVEVVVGRVDHGTATTVDLELVNRGDEPVFVESLTARLRWCGHGAASHRFLRHGWQSWSHTGYRDLDDVGEPPFPSGAWLRGMYHCLGARAAERNGWHESETVALVGAPSGGPCCLVGALETGRAFAVLHLRPVASAGADERAVEIDAELRVEAPLAPGEHRRLESLRVAVGDDPNALLERFATLWGRVGGARNAGPYQVGWCSWYHYFHRISEADMLRNLDVLAAERDAVPIEVVQLDDGYQRTIGDWLHTNDRFPGGLERVATAIHDAGFTAGLWTAPFAASAESELLQRHPDWTLRDGDDPLRGTLNPEWSHDGWVYVLDTSRPEVRAHLEQTFRDLVALGFPYQKLDFLYMAAMQGGAADPTSTRAERLRAGLDAIRRGAGEDAFLLGCGCPMGPAVGVVDGMRIGPDVAPSWGVDQPVVIPGLEAMLPSTASALRSIGARLFMHRRLWQNDPDCLMARSRETALQPDEARSLAAAIAVSGGMMVMSDDLTLLDREELAMVSRVVETGRAVDRARPGACRDIAPLSDDAVMRLEAPVNADVHRAFINLGDFAEKTVRGPAAAGSSNGAGVLLREISARDAAPDAESVGPHASRAVLVAGRRSLAVFSDFDGTFSTRDVGSTLAQQYLAERRTELWERYEAGEVDAWQYAELLFDGFAYGPDRLDDFLRTIALDPGARALVDWCASRSVPLRVLSDGFDHNLERMQALHGVHFTYLANHLRFDGDRWRISPAGRNSACDCGTGACKRAVIDAYRAEHPDHCLVHIGNGRVSDRCGAEAADLVFAKETLASDLDARGVAYSPFETLHDVVATLDADWGAGC